MESSARPVACGDLAPLEEILRRYPREEPSLIQVLQDVQRAYHYLPCEVLERVAEALGVPLSKVFQVSTFYRAFSLTPKGRVVVKVCTGTACHIRGAPQIIDEVRRRLGIGPGETTPDLGVTLETVNCVGACAMAPVVIVNDRYQGGVRPASVGDLLEPKE